MRERNKAKDIILFYQIAYRPLSFAEQMFDVNRNFQLIEHFNFLDLKEGLDVKH